MISIWFIKKNTENTSLTKTRAIAQDAPANSISAPLQNSAKTEKAISACDTREEQKPLCQVAVVPAAAAVITETSDAKGAFGESRAHSMRTPRFEKALSERSRNNKGFRWSWGRRSSRHGRFWRRTVETGLRVGQWKIRCFRSCRTGKWTGSAVDGGFLR